MDIRLRIIVLFSYLYGFFEIFMGVRQRIKRKSKVVQKSDKGSIWLMLFLIAAGYFLGFNAKYSGAGEIDLRNTLFVAGIIIMFSGLIIRIKSIQTLKQQFTYTVKKIENHRLVEKGLYKKIRHPGYLGQLLIFFGVAVAFSNWLSTILMFTPVLAGYLNRIRIEERFLKLHFGQNYIDYQGRTKKLIPGIF